ncbi:MAG TPA: hypothetical protein VN887_14930 [Candidatus Angelobacter sp.]|nr:hypothetical protein [Candidatus Angelobacter sp.]
MKQKQRYWLFKRGHTYYLEDSVSGEQKSLCTSNRQEAERIRLAKKRGRTTPSTWLGFGESLLSCLDPTGGWHRGTSYRPPLAFNVGLNEITAVGSPITPPGMILHHVFSIPQIVKRKAVQTAVAENAEDEDSVGIAAQNALMGAF